MTTVSSAVLKDHLADYLQRAERGEQVVVLRDGKPVAALVPVPAVGELSEDAQIAKLVAAGVLKMPKRPTEDAFQGTPVISPGKPASQMIIEDRR